jgi:hypothetical protein
MFRIESNWTENSNGNFVLRECSGGDVTATVYQTEYAVWQIIINGDYGGQLVANEHYADAEEAIERADQILGGATCQSARSTANSSTAWAKQKSMFNGKPTYGRKCGSYSATVKCAASGKWYFMTYSGQNHSAPQGWYGTAEHAQQACDSRHQ